ncbi:MAG: hypothetical protein JWQ88_1233 [Rhodoferax sp.]|nr:hypothetical protein [Rhodoferax sp.]
MNRPPPSVSLCAQQVLHCTALAWSIAPRTAQAAARAAPHGYVPVRARRRQSKLGMAGARALSAIGFQFAW